MPVTPGLTGITLRPIGPEDQVFLYRVYASTRLEELAPVGWNTSEQEAFLWFQFQAQHTYYQQMYAAAEYSIILWQGQQVGRLYLDYRSDEIRIIDIALLPEFRRQGLGTRLLSDIQSQAQQAGLAVRIHVERFNPALALYQHLGFRQIEDRGAYYFMEWTA